MLTPADVAAIQRREEERAGRGAAFFGWMLENGRTMAMWVAHEVPASLANAGAS